MATDDPTRERYIERAIELAEGAGDRGDRPFGSVLVRDGEIVAEDANRVVTDDDLALHPELSLARWAGRELSRSAADETVMYTSTEPCPMCAAGVGYAGLGGVVYSVPGARARAIGGGEAEGIPCVEVFDRLGAAVTVDGPVCEADGLAVLREYL